MWNFRDGAARIAKETGLCPGRRYWWLLRCFQGVPESPEYEV